MTHVLHCPLSLQALAREPIGRRADGRLIYSIAGGSAPVEPPAAPAAPPAAPPAPAPAPTPAAPAGPAAPAAPSATWDGKPESIADPAIRKAYERAIAEAANASGKAREDARTAAAREARAALLKELGLVEDPNAAPDPAKLAQQLADERAVGAAAVERARDSAIKLAVYTGAPAHQGDPAALLDSNTFMASVKDFDPAAADFATKVDGAIKAAVAANQKLKAGQAPGVSGGQFPGGPGGGGTRPTSLGAAVGAAYKS